MSIGIKSLVALSAVVSMAACQNDKGAQTAGAIGNPPPSPDGGMTTFSRTTSKGSSFGFITNDVQKVVVVNTGGITFTKAEAEAACRGDTALLNRWFLQFMAQDTELKNKIRAECQVEMTSQDKEDNPGSCLESRKINRQGAKFGLTGGIIANLTVGNTPVSTASSRGTSSQSNAITQSQLLEGSNTSQTNGLSVAQSAQGFDQNFRANAQGNGSGLGTANSGGTISGSQKVDLSQPAGQNECRTDIMRICGTIVANQNRGQRYEYSDLDAIRAKCSIPNKTYCSGLPQSWVDLHYPRRDGWTATVENALGAAISAAATASANSSSASNVSGQQNGNQNSGAVAGSNSAANTNGTIGNNNTLSTTSSGNSESESRSGGAYNQFSVGIDVAFSYQAPSKDETTEFVPPNRTQSYYAILGKDGQGGLMQATLDKLLQGAGCAAAGIKP